MNARLAPSLSLAALLCLSWTVQGQTPTALFEPGAPTPVAELPIGALLPDLQLQKEDATFIHLSDLRGQAIALTFIYARCPAPTLCPMVSRNFDVTQKLLNRLEIAKYCHLLSISLDREHDTPDVLAAYAATYTADPLHWTFATGPEEEVRRVGGAVGLEFRHVDGRIDHNLRTVVLDASGRIRHIFRGDSWTPQDLVAVLDSVVLHP